MKVFVAGATGAIGRNLVPALLKAGHSVTGMTRTHGKAASLPWWCMRWTGLHWLLPFERPSPKSLFTNSHQFRPA